MVATQTQTSRQRSSTLTTTDGLDHVTHDIGRLLTQMVNLYFVGAPGASDWVLVDTGMFFNSHRILRAAARRYGPNSRPRAIILTHGHFDHIGNVRKLAETWDVPVYAHELELPYLTGKADYPPPDPTVGGGMMARTSFMLPRSGIDISNRVQALPSDESIPHMPGWRWIATPGHSPGHISLFRESDRALIAGDAFITTQQESIWSVMTQEEVMHGPPMYFTQDWNAARESVQRLAALDPFIAATGHGPPMFGKKLLRALSWLANEFDRAAIPHDGRYVREPARFNENGPQYVPPPIFNPTQAAVMAGMGLAVIGAVASLVRRKD
jgi:glyoxylase-like metal-dependent hydrolase (beta-lactamase superfamily II)